MSYLIDTHVVIWWMTSDDRIRPEIAKIFENEQIVISAASIWEIGIKIKSGKLALPSGFLGDLVDLGFKILPINEHHAVGVMDLDTIHLDPFDRIMISQAIAEKMILVTADKNILKYPGVRILPA